MTLSDDVVNEDLDLRAIAALDAARMGRLIRLAGEDMAFFALTTGVLRYLLERCGEEVALAVRTALADEANADLRALAGYAEASGLLGASGDGAALMERNAERALRHYLPEISPPGR